MGVRQVNTLVGLPLKNLIQCFLMPVEKWHWLRPSLGRAPRLPQALTNIVSKDRCHSLQGSQNSAHDSPWLSFRDHQTTLVPSPQLPGTQPSSDSSAVWRSSSVTEFSQRWVEHSAVTTEEHWRVNPLHCTVNICLQRQSQEQSDFFFFGGGKVEQLSSDF